MKSHWRSQAAPIIEAILTDTKGADERTIRSRLRSAYPFGPRKHWPYRVWCDEVRRQRGLPRKPLRSRKRKRTVPKEQMAMPLITPMHVDAYVCHYPGCGVERDPWNMGRHSASTGHGGSLIRPKGAPPPSEYCKLRASVPLQVDLRHITGYAVAEDPDSGDFIVVITTKEHPDGIGLVMDPSTEQVFSGSGHFESTTAEQFFAASEDSDGSPNAGG